MLLRGWKAGLPRCVGAARFFSGYSTSDKKGRRREKYSDVLREYHPGVTSIGSILRADNRPPSLLQVLDDVEKRRLELNGEDLTSEEKAEFLDAFAHENQDVGVHEANDRIIGELLALFSKLVPRRTVPDLEILAAMLRTANKLHAVHTSEVVLGLICSSLKMRTRSLLPPPRRKFSEDLNTVILKLAVAKDGWERARAVFEKAVDAGIQVSCETVCALLTVAGKHGTAAIREAVEMAERTLDTVKQHPKYYLALLAAYGETDTPKEGVAAVMEKMTVNKVERLPEHYLTILRISTAQCDLEQGEKVLGFLRSVNAYVNAITLASETLNLYTVCDIEKAAPHAEELEKLVTATPVHNSPAPFEALTGYYARVIEGEPHRAARLVQRAERIVPPNDPVYLPALMTVYVAAGDVLKAEWARDQAYLHMCRAGAKTVSTAVAAMLPSAYINAHRRASLHLFPVHIVLMKLRNDPDLGEEEASSAPNLKLPDTLPQKTSPAPPAKRPQPTPPLPVPPTPVITTTTSSTFHSPRSAYSAPPVLPDGSPVRR